MSHAGGSKAIIAALGANLGIAHDQVRRVRDHRCQSSMLAEGVHSVVDSGNQGLLLVGAAVGQAPRGHASIRSATAASATSTPSSSG